MKSSDAVDCINSMAEPERMEPAIRTVDSFVQSLVAVIKRDQKQYLDLAEVAAGRLIEMRRLEDQCSHLQTLYTKSQTIINRIINEEAKSADIKAIQILDKMREERDAQRLEEDSPPIMEGRKYDDAEETRCCKDE